MYSDLNNEDFFPRIQNCFSMCVLVYPFSKQKNGHLDHFTSITKSYNLIILVLYLEAVILN